MANRRGKGGSSDRFPLLGSKITADGDSGHEIRRRLLFGGKVMTNLDSVLKSRDITLPTKVHIVQAVVSPVKTKLHIVKTYGLTTVMHSCESWTARKAECHRIAAFKMWC